MVMVRGRANGPPSRDAGPIPSVSHDAGGPIGSQAVGSRSSRHPSAVVLAAADDLGSARYVACSENDDGYSCSIDVDDVGVWITVRSRMTMGRGSTTRYRLYPWAAIRCVEYCE